MAGPELNPRLFCTQRELAFGYWMKAQGSTALADDADERAAFDVWWTESVITSPSPSIYQLCYNAWLAGGDRKFSETWGETVETSRLLSVKHGADA